MKKIKILHISKDLVGGIGTVILSFIKFFNKNDFSSLYKALDNNSKYKNKLIKTINNYLILKKTIKSLDFNLLHFHGAWTLHILLLRNKFNVPSLISPHGSFDEISLKKSKIKKIIAKFLFMKKSYLKADCIHALTLKEAQDIRNYGITNTPVAVIPNGIDMDETLNINKNLKIKLLKLAGDRKIILSLSRLHISKGIDILIDAFSKLEISHPNNVLFIVGSGDNKYTSHLKDKIKKLNLENMVFLIGKMNGNDKNTVYNIADLFVLPSFNEGFGLTFLEAYRQKVPVITTTATPFQEIKDIQCGWYVEPTIDDIYSALYEAITLDNLELQRKGEIGYNLVKNKYDIHITNANMKELYTYLVYNTKKPNFFYTN